MKPIDAKERPKIIALVVLSVLMIGFFLKTLLGSMAAKNAPAPNPAPPATPPVATTGTYPTPAPGTPNAGLVASNDAIETGGPANPFRKVLPEPGRLDPFPAVKPPKMGRPIGGRLPTAGPIPVGDGGIGGNGLDVQPVGAAPAAEPKIRLDGVVSDRANYAMVTFGERSDMYRAGAKIGGLYEVISIDEFGASFRGPRGVFRLEVGQEHGQAPEAAPPKKAAPDDARLMDDKGRSGVAPLLPIPSDYALNRRDR